MREHRGPRRDVVTRTPPDNLPYPQSYGMAERYVLMGYWTTAQYEAWHDAYQAGAARRAIHQPRFQPPPRKPPEPVTFHKLPKGSPV
jgi:hypothetical protein